MAKVEELYERAGVIHQDGACPICDCEEVAL